MVADVVARIGRDLVMGMNVTTVGPGTPAGSARGARTVRGAATGSSTQAPGRKEVVARPMKKLKGPS